MIIYHKSDLMQYLENDWILKMLEESMKDEEKEIRTNQWLLEMDNKRMIYADVYGDILKGEMPADTRVLDVGGGVNALTKRLAEHCQYSLADFLAHGGSDYLHTFSDKYRVNWINSDWFETDYDNYDLVIANDIFPDVDMRLELFLEKMLPKCRELRIVITWYNAPRFYQMGRRDDPEVLTFLSWDGEITALKMRKYLDRMPDTMTEELDRLPLEKESIYHNGRQIGYLKVRGEL